MTPVTASWLESCLKARQLIHPDSDSIFTPISWDSDRREDVQSIFSPVMLCLSGFSDIEKVHLLDVS